MNSALIGHLSPTVALHHDGSGSVTACAACGHTLGPAADPWKNHAVRRDVPLADAGGPAYDTGYGGVVLRHFFCPACAALLDTETATDRDPVLIDRLAEKR